MGLRSSIVVGQIILSVGAGLLMVGCGAGNIIDLSKQGGLSTPVTGAALSGHVHGGQQPIKGATIALYAAGKTGYGTGETSLLSSAVTSDANGAFSIDKLYMCPAASSQIYLISTGGDAGAGSNNVIKLITALGSCGGINTAAGTIDVSEVSSVAAVYSLAHFMKAGTISVGSSATNANGLLNAFATVGNLVDPATGSARIKTPAGNGIVPQSRINSLANIMASCVNTSGSGGACSTLFSLATPAGGTAPTDTLSALINIASNPGLNVAQLYNLVGAKAYFQPTLTAAPNDLTLSIEYTGGGLHAAQLPAIDAAGNIWVPNATDPGTLSEFSPIGEPLSGVGFAGGGLSYPESLAIDLLGNVWTANEGNASVSKHTSGGTALSGSTGYTAAGMRYPYGIAIDGAGSVFTANGNNTVAKLNAAGTAVGMFTGGGLDVPYAVAIDGAANVWVANADQYAQSNSISKFSNTGTPMAQTAYTGAGLRTPVGIAVDAGGNVWAANLDNTVVSKLSSSGVPLSGSGFVTPAATSAVAIDGDSTAWTANLDGSVSHFSNAGTALSPKAGFIAADATSAVGVVIDASGNVWTTDYYLNSLFEYVGAAAPAVVPQALAVKNNTLGQRP